MCCKRLIRWGLTRLTLLTASRMIQYSGGLHPMNGPWLRVPSEPLVLS